MRTSMTFFLSDGYGVDMVQNVAVSAAQPSQCKVSHAAHHVYVEWMAVVTVVIWLKEPDE
jgi:hypothetical protein